MRPFRQRTHGPRRLTLLFACVLRPPAIALVGLSATLFSQDRAMLAQRALERQEASADAITLALGFVVPGHRPLVGGRHDGHARRGRSSRPRRLTGLETLLSGYSGSEYAQVAAEVWCG